MANTDDATVAPLRAHWNARQDRQPYALRLGYKHMTGFPSSNNRSLQGAGSLVPLMWMTPRRSCR